jgi:hypothetical protein
LKKGKEKHNNLKRETQNPVSSIVPRPKPLPSPLAPAPAPPPLPAPHAQDRPTPVAQLPARLQVPGQALQGDAGASGAVRGPPPPWSPAARGQPPGPTNTCCSTLTRHQAHGDRSGWRRWAWQCSCFHNHPSPGPFRAYWHPSAGPCSLWPLRWAACPDAGPPGPTAPASPA